MDKDTQNIEIHEQKRTKPYKTIITTTKNQQKKNEYQRYRIQENQKMVTRLTKINQIKYKISCNTKLQNGYSHYITTKRARIFQNKSNQIIDRKNVIKKRIKKIACKIHTKQIKIFSIYHQ